MASLITIISNVDDTSAILELRDRFEQWGLTVQQAASGKIFICRIVEGKPSHNTLYEDYFPVGMPNRPLSDRVMASLVEFVRENKGAPQTLVDDTSQAGNFALYGDNVRRDRVDSDLIKAINEFLGN